MKLIDLIVGARPNFVKVAPIIAAFTKDRPEERRLAFRLVHTGQHYDQEMSGSFFEQLGIPAPHVNLGVGSGTQAEQTAFIMIRYEQLLLRQRSDLCLVFGDVNSTLACSVAARKLGVDVAHVEAGIRSGDWSMPEEVNRVVTDSISNYFFTTSEVANAQLRASGVAEERIYFVGNTMIDTLIANLGRLKVAGFWDSLALGERGYFLLTLHRPANVDDPRGLRSVLEAIGAGCRGETVVFPVHPRTAKSLSGLGTLPGNIALVEPQPYLEFIHLVQHARAVITDSGGITEEATVLGVPCMTLRDSTERPETVTIGTNVLLGTNPAALAPALDRLFEGRWKTGGIPELWDGRAGERIVTHLEHLLVEPGCRASKASSGVVGLA
jgi:UDP-N-acetylglucosamine 2-epimerase (non-hydrolysing)